MQHQCGSCIVSFTLHICLSLNQKSSLFDVAESYWLSEFRHSTTALPIG